MKTILLVALVALSLGCGTPDDVEVKDSALSSAQIWQTNTPLTRIGQTLTCNGTTYRVRQAVAQYQAGTGYMTELAWMQALIDSSRGEFSIWCPLDYAMTNFVNALASNYAQVCYLYSHVAGEHEWTYDGAINMPFSGVYYAPKGSVHPDTGVTYASGFWRLSISRYSTPSDGNGRLTSCLGSQTIADVY